MMESKKSLLVEIFILSIISVLTIIIFSNIQMQNKKGTMALFMNDEALELEEISSGNILLMPIKDSLITEEQSAQYQIKNNGKDTFYRFILVVDKDSTFDLHYIHFKVNQFYGRLNEVSYQEDSLYYYYDLIGDKIGEQEIQNISFNIWLDDSYKENFMNQRFSYYMMISDHI